MVEKYFKLILGMMFVVVGLYSALYWVGDFLTLIKGGLGIITFIVGLFIILIGVTDIS